MRPDKQTHIKDTFGGVLAAQLFMPLGIAVLLVMLVGIAKEVLWDFWLKKGTPDAYDVLANIVGACAAVLLVLLSRYLWGIR